MLFLLADLWDGRWENAKKNAEWIMKDDSFVVEAFVKNAGKNYRNHKWIKKKFQFLCCTQTYEKSREKSSSRKFLRWSCLMANTRQQKKNIFPEIEDRRDSGSHRRCCYRILLMDDATWRKWSAEKLKILFLIKWLGFQGFCMNFWDLWWKPSLTVKECLIKFASDFLSNFK